MPSPSAKNIKVKKTIGSPASIVKLLPMSARHLKNTLDWLSDPDLRRKIDSLGSPTPDSHHTYWKKQWNDIAQENYAIIDAQGVHIGNCGFHHIDIARRKAELWIYLGLHRGKSLGTLAVQKLLLRAFEKLKLNRVYARVLTNNPAAIKLFQSIGFVQEGIFRQDTVHGRQYLDSIYFSMLRKEYSSLIGVRRSSQA